MQQLYETIFYSQKVNALFTDDAFLGYMLQFEGALAQAQAKYKVIPGKSANTIKECCRIENINKEQLITEAGLGGNINIPLVKQLTAVVQKNKAAAKFVHFGATSQDVIDTAIMLQARDAVQIIAEDLQQLIQQLVSLAEKHRSTVMTGRSFLQHARPVTFGYKVAGWLDSLLRSQNTIAELLKCGFVLQLGGAVGTLSGMQDQGLQVSGEMSELLSLNNPSKPWHTQRDYFVSISSALGILTGNLGKLAKDISLLMQTEIAEVFESLEKGKGGSSTMPHKRNPVGCIAILANAARVPGLVAIMFSCLIQEQERAGGNWHAEWETFSSIIQLSAGAINKAIEVTGGLEIRKQQMLYNLELTRGLIYAENVSFALAKKMGKADAHLLIEKCCKEAEVKKIHLKEVLTANAVIANHLDPEKISALFNPLKSLGLSEQYVQRVLDKVKSHPYP